MSGSSAESTAIGQSLIELRTTQLGEVVFPQFVYSYSSEGFPDLASRYRYTCGIPPRHLISLYDIHYNYVDASHADGLVCERRVRFLDSGQYEARAARDRIDTHLPPCVHRKWGREEYAKTLSVVVRPGDVVVGYDDESLSLVDQVGTQLDTFRGLPNDTFKDMLLIPVARDWDQLVACLEPALGYISIVGFPDRDLGSSVAERLQALYGIRKALNRLTRPDYLPIHVFGCLDPGMASLMYLAGGDIFDGLSWMKYYFRGLRTLARWEFQLTEGLEISEGPKLEWMLLANNVGILEQLSNDLHYAVACRDFSGFEWAVETLTQVLDLGG